MAAVYNWEIDEVFARPYFTDKNGVERQNVIKFVKIIYKGVDEENKKQYASDVKIVTFDLVDLSNFTDHTSLTKSDVLGWALAKLDAEEKLRIENSVKQMLGDYTATSNIVILDLNE